MRAALLLSLPPLLEAKALALRGGGWRAQTSDAGLFSGLLAFAAKQRGVPATFLDTGLLADFDEVATNSGSSWFFSSLAYSPGYKDLIESMAAAPASAAALHHELYSVPWLRATNVDLAKFNLREQLARDVVKKLFGAADEELLFQFQYFLSTDLNWNYFTELLLSSTAGIGNATMGSEVNAFAEGKTWIVANTVLVPANNYVRLYQDSDEYPRVNYEARSDEEIPALLPAKFSIVLGAGEGSSAPHDYLPPGSFEGVELHYNAVIDVLAKPEATSAVLDGRDFAAGVLHEGVGSLPVSRVASSSSAAGGIAPVLGLLVNEGLAILDADLTPWVSNAEGGAAFRSASELVEGLSGIFGRGKSTIQALADLQVHGAIDGGYVDNTALGAAVAAGATEVLVVLNTQGNETGDSDLDVLFRDGPAPYAPMTSSEIYPVFDSPAGDFSAFQELTLPSTSYLKRIAVGSFTATTASNKYFGVEAGREVTINVVQLCSNLGDAVGGKISYESYDAIVQEIISAINDAANFDLVSKTLLPMFTGTSLSVIV